MGAAIPPAAAGTELPELVVTCSEGPQCKACAKHGLRHVGLSGAGAERRVARWIVGFLSIFGGKLPWTMAGDLQ